MIGPGQAALLGLVEGITEFLPISSTGHLILASQLMNLHGEAVKTFDVVIQAGALGAVIGLYRTRLVSIWRGLLGRDEAGRSLSLNLLVSFLPAAVLGGLLHQPIKMYLFGAWPVIAALAVGGVLMIVVDAWWHRTGTHTVRSPESMTLRDALLIGVAQCAALWPGTSRSMVTIVAALLLGFPATVAAEYSFLLALPTLGAATLFDAVSGGRVLLQQASGLAIVCGFVVAAIVAALSIQGLIRYLTRGGLAPFGWYRLGLAGLAWAVLPR